MNKDGAAKILLDHAEVPFALSQEERVAFRLAAYVLQDKTATKFRRAKQRYNKECNRFQRKPKVGVPDAAVGH